MKLSAPHRVLVPPVFPNAGVEAAYRRVLRALVDDMCADVQEQIIPLYKRTALAMDGEAGGHEFRGNQWTGGIAGERIDAAVKELQNFAHGSKGTLNERNIILERKTGEELGRFDQNLVMAPGELRYIQGEGSGFSNADMFDKDGELRPDGSVLHMHTHPIDQTFSDGDLRVFVRGTIGEMRVVTAEHEYTLTKTKEFTERPSVEHNPSHIQKVYDEHQERIFQEHFAKNPDDPDFAHNIIQETIPSVAKAMGFKYSVKAISGTTYAAAAMDETHEHYAGEFPSKPREKGAEKEEEARPTFRSLAEWFNKEMSRRTALMESGESVNPYWFDRDQRVSMTEIISQADKMGLLPQEHTPGYNAKMFDFRMWFWGLPKSKATGMLNMKKYHDPGEGDAAMSHDAAPKRNPLQSKMKKLRVKWEAHFDEVAPTVAETFATQAASHADMAFSGALNRSGFSVPFKFTKELERAIGRRVSDNVGLIKSIPSEFFGEIQAKVMESVKAGRDLKHLTEHLQHSYGVTKRRAEDIARDQNNKATAAIHQLRQKALGITQGVWRHTMASVHPRESHAAFDGETYNTQEGHDFDDGFGPVIPGEAINCGCVSYSIIPGYDEEEAATPTSTGANS